MQVKDIMTRGVDSVQVTDTVKQAAEKMKIHNVGVIPVFEGGNPSGMITDRDITIRAVAEGRDTTQMKVNQIMTSDVVSCPEDADVRDAADMMESRKIRRLLVRDNQGSIVGILSMGDLVTHVGSEMSAEAIREVSEPSRPVR